MGITIFERLGAGSGWAREGIAAVIALALGFALMPLLIFLAGSSLLGRYEAGSPARIYDGVYRGLSMGSLASWVVVFGPYALYLIFKALRWWWRASAKLA